MKDAENQGSPSNVYRSGLLPIDSKKVIRVLIYPIDFVDFQGKLGAKLDFSELKTKLTEFYGSVSGGKVKFAWSQIKSYSRMNTALNEYEANSRSNLNSIVRIIQDAQELAFKSLNRENFDFFIAAPPSNTTVDKISTSVALLQKDEKFINGTILAGDYWQSGQSWTLPAHELGHALGLLDLYSLETSNTGFSEVIDFHDQFQFMGFFDLMNWPTGPAPELSAWNRWSLGFIPEEQVRCLPSSLTVTKLSPIESKAVGIKALFVKLDSSRMLVLENRAPLGFDRQLPNWASGILVYLVNLDIESGSGPLRIVMKSDSESQRIFNQSLQSGESTNFEGVLIENLSDLKGQSLVRVSRNLQGVILNPKNP